MKYSTQPFRRLGCFILLVLALPLAAAHPAAAQCPVPSLAPPTLDGALDPIYLQRGFTTDYTANDGSTASLHQLDDVCIDSQYIWLAWEITLGFVDNSYGANRNQGENFPWPKGHSFYDLAESDGQRLQILNVCGEDVVDLFMDYLDGPIGGGPSYATPSGYGVGTGATETTLFQINGGDWSRFTYDTSQAHNLNDLGFCTAGNCQVGPTDLLVDSPPWANEDDFVPQAPFDDWIYRHFYEMRIDRSVFSTASCPQGTPALIRTDPVELHASPSKLGTSPVGLFRASSAIGDYVWLDADRDGIQDAGEPGLGNVTLDLYRDDGDGVFEPDLPVVDGRFDVDGDGGIDGDDDGAAAGAAIVDGLLDLDGDGVGGETNGDDDGTLSGLLVDDGRIDLDGSGTVDGADDGLFAGDDGAVAATTVTDANGRYLFGRLGAGTYFVDVTDEHGVLAGLARTSGAQSSTDPTGAIVLPIREEYLLADFGYAPADSATAVVGDYVWSDADADGIQDRGEPGIGGVTVDLVDFDTGTVVATTTTAADGSYLFTGVAPGSYRVDVTDVAGVLAGYTLTSGPQAESDPSTPFSVSAGTVYLNADFGYFAAGLGSIGNQVWFDVDEDGVFDAGEPGIGNVSVALVDDADGDGVWDPGELIVATTSTATDGTYAFPGLRLDDGGGDGDADYLVWVSDTRNVLVPFLESVYLPLGSTADGISKIPAYAVDLSAGTPSDVTADFGYILDNPLALVGDRVWYDVDGDGAQDPAEPGIEDVRVLLYYDKNQNGTIDGSKNDPLLAHRTTDINGNYYFQRLDFDNNGEGYIVVVSELNGADLVDGELDLDRDGDVDALDSGTLDGFTVISGRVDVDGNGSITAADDGLVSGFKILDGRVDLDSDGAIETNGDDSRFAPLGTYTPTGDPDEAGTCSVCDERAGTVASTGNTSILTLDFGYDSIGTFAVGDTVYHDLDADGTQGPGEPGLESVTLALVRDIDGDGAVGFDEPVVAQAVTDAAGEYLFDDLVLDDYIVVITDDNGILTGYTQTQGSPFEPVDGAELSTLDKDFGFVRNLPAAIGDFVWHDLDGDGVQDAGEPGLPNVVVNLWSAGPDGQPGGGDDSLVGSMTTDATGAYGFSVQNGVFYVEVVPPGGYVVTARDQGSDSADSDVDPATGRSVATTLIIGESDLTWDAGLYRPVAIGDRVWLDVDGDGVQDVGEPGIANVAVTLLDAGGAPLATAVTDLQGGYVFAGYAPGGYRVDLDAGTLPAGLALSGGSDPSSSAVLASGESVFDKDFGYTPTAGTAVIGDFVWSDADADGVQDLGEPGIGGVTLDLVSPGGDGVFGTADDVVEATTTTAADGSYLFSSLAAGRYRVAVTDTGGVLAGYTATSGPHASPSPTAAILVAGGTAYLDADFGYFQAGLGTVGTHVWYDADGNGRREGAETTGGGLGGVTLALVADGDGDGVWDAGEPIVASTRTAIDGSYAFTGVAFGDYLVVVSDTAGVTVGWRATAGTPGTDDHGQTSPYAVSPSAAAPSRPTADFGFVGAGTIGDLVWHDTDGDGARDAGEPGIGGVTVELRDGATGALLATATTAGDGSYLFELLPPGSYRVVITDTGNVLAGYAQTADPDESGACATCDGESTTAIGAGGSDLDRDFGYRNPNLHSISGTVFGDTDRDGRHDDPPESGFAGVTLELWHDVDGDGVIDPAVDELRATTTTDGAGDYRFPGLPDDQYVVTVTDAAGVLTGYELTSGLDSIAVEIAGADVTDVDFGYVRDAAVGTIGDTVWLDANADGVRGPTESGIGGVTVVLYRDGAEVARRVTDGNGEYLFDRLVAGDYTVDLDESTLPGGLVATTGTVDPTAVIPLAEGERYPDADFGWVPTAGTAVLGDRVWHDADGDGLQDPGEVGIAGIDITVEGPSCAPCTVTTDAEGKWLLTGLQPGDYTVDYDPVDVQAAGYDPVPTNTGGEPTWEITAAAGDVFLHLDYGFERAAGAGSIGDTVWFDRDADGVQDPDEEGIQGVTLDLYDLGPDGQPGGGDDVFLGTTTTGPQGLYDFTGLGAGTYSVRVTDTGNVLAGLDLTTANPTGPIVLGAGEDHDDADFGAAPAGGVGSIGNLVWHDENGNGRRDAGEDGIEGVTVALWRDVDGDGAITPGVDNRVRTAATDANGTYGFIGLPLDRYLVDVTDAVGVLGGFTKTAGTADTDDHGQADPYAVVLGSATPNVPWADFGYRGGPWVLDGTVFEDEDQDAFFDDGVEFEVGDVEMLLYRIVGGRAFLIGRTRTDAFGFYRFADLPDGSYEVVAVTEGSDVDGWVQTTQTATGGRQPATIAGADSHDNDVGFYNGGATTTPVTLAAFSSEGGGGRVRFAWTTATEVGNVGFNLWSLGADGWRRINERPIPSKVVDSTVPQHYELEAAGVVGETFFLEDLDVFGASRFHGPFELGTAHGNAELAVEAIDWAAIRAANAASAAAGGPARVAARQSTTFGTGEIHLEVSRDGVYRVSYEELAAAGLHLDGAPLGHLALTVDGEPVPLRVEGRGVFGPGSWIEFVGAARDGLYGPENVYVLRVDRGLARAVEVDRRPVRPKDAVADFYLEERRIEVDRTYSPLAPNGDPWFDAWLYTFGDPASAALPFDLDEWVEGAAPVTVRAELWGATATDQDPDHHVILVVGGLEVAAERFDGQVARTLAGEVPDSLLAGAGNELEVVLPADTGADLEMVMVDAYAVVYPRRFVARDGELAFRAAGDAFTVTGLPDAEVVVYRDGASGLERVERVEVTGVPGDYRATFRGTAEPATYRVASAAALAAPALSLPAAGELEHGTAELLVITHETFLPALEPLVERRRAEGWSVGVSPVEAVFDRWGHGQFGPEGIRRYVAHAAATQGTTHVLLVGGDTYDYRDLLGKGSISFVPSPYAATGELVRFAPADALYGDLDGDRVPDLAIGRLPVRTAAELEVLVEKILDYDAAGAAGASALVAADGRDGGAGFSFSNPSEQLAAMLPGGWPIERVYLDELSTPQARAALLDAMNEGPRVASYMGHSGPTEWSFEGLFTAADATSLSNVGRPMLVTQWGCWTTYYVAPGYDTLGHRLLLSGDRGAAAVLGAATLTEARSERALARQIYLRLFDPGRTVGEVLLEGKRALAALGDPASEDVVLGWTLLGDPTMVVVP